MAIRKLPPHKSPVVHQQSQSPNLHKGTPVQSVGKSSSISTHSPGDYTPSEKAQGQGIADFYAFAIKHDFARQHQFRIVDWKSYGENVLPEEGYSLYLETAQLPARETINVTVNYIGMTYNVPGMATYSGASYPVTFKCDKDFVLRKAFEDMSLLNYNDQDTTGNFIAPGDDSYLTIGLLNKDMVIIKYYTLMGVSLINPGSITYNLGDTGSIVKMDVTLSYHFWLQGKVK